MNAPHTTSVLIMAGGTGGHIYPGLAVAHALRERGVSVRWLGAADGMEGQKVPPHGIPMDEIHIKGLRGKGLKGWLSLPFRLLRAIRESAVAMREHPPGCAVSFGGYVAGPGGLAARLRGVPLLVHEQNRIPGMTNKALSQLAQTVMQAFDGAFAKAITCGNPVRAEVAALPEPSLRWADRTGRPRLLVTGGSQGARALNELLPEAISRLPEAVRPLIQHQAGESGEDATAAAYHELGVEANVSAFIDDMAAAYAWADLVVCRAGALTVSELAAAGLGSILVPFPQAVDDHQTANARVLVHAGAAKMAPQSTLTAENLAGLLEPLFSDRDETLKMAEAARTVAVPDAAGTVADACLALVKT